jgi:hypothetical protein
VDDDVVPTLVFTVRLLALALVLMTGLAGGLADITLLPH